jgi:hypothetical protein
MPIQFECVCGKKLQAKDEHAGKQTRCPSCGRRLVIGPAATVPISPFNQAAIGGAFPVAAPPPLPGQVAPQGVLSPAFVPRNYYGAGSDTEVAASPLSADQLDELKQTEMFRRRIRQAAIWFRIQYLITLILTVLGAAGMIISLVAAGQKVRPEGVAIVATGFAFYAGIACLFYFAHKSTMDCQRWAPLVMMILNCFGAVLVFASCLAAEPPQRDRTPMLVAGGVGSLLPLLIAYICYRAWDAIPKFLAQPQWCQQTLRHCGL